MDRILYHNDRIGNKNKYILRNEYRGFGIYQEKTPTGYFVSQEWALSNGDIVVIIPSYNNMCKEELFEIIDNYEESGKFGIRALFDDNHHIMHNSGICI